MDHSLETLTKPVKPKADQKALTTFFQPTAGTKRKRKTDQPASQDFAVPPSVQTSTETVKWLRAGTLLIGQFGSPEARPKVAGFDLDHTLIRVQGNHTFAKHADDWQFVYKCVPRRLRELHDSGYKVVIFTNQGGLRRSFDKGNHKAFNKYRIFSEKIEKVAKAIQVPFQLLAATDYDLYRKPRGAMWRFFEQYLNNRVILDLGSSYYVGDAAGRPGDWQSGKPKDFSDTDRKFSVNLNIKFFTPEEYFLDEPAAPFSYGDFVPHTFPLSETDQKDTTKQIVKPADSTELVLLVGCPASGKTTLVKNIFIPAGYVHINQDTLKTRTKCLAVCREALTKRQSVVVDNTNADRTTRKFYLSLAQELGYPARCIHLQTNRAVAEHNNWYRAHSSLDQDEFIVRNALPDHPDLPKVSYPHIIPTIAYNTYNSRFETPSTDEGFTEVLQVPFTLDTAWWQGNGDVDKQLAKWRQWYL
ncbi:DNA kinase/phosphatase Pnk1 [Dispira parvispora]|uniref:DNA kinase/phosphatase Pnk1 n=1 Tax=Dispira parvispora TaxID=1520584 RepID=A0A9W8E4U2_9FUNG|nr:DNA kinase/phosphatase Pnk1 [Dispira parvispora]